MLLPTGRTVLTIEIHFSLRADHIGGRANASIVRLRGIWYILS